MTMEWFKDELEIRTDGKGLYAVTDDVEKMIREWGVHEGMCFLYLPHASASLTITESYDSSARRDVEEFYERTVPEGESWYNHTLEGPDDSPSHIRATLTQPSLTIPIAEGALRLGTWQGVFVFDHRSRGRCRHLLVHCLKIS